jgi:FkbH-like protein
MPLSVPEALLSMHREGRLAVEYPAVRGLIAELSGDELARAGTLLSRLDPDEVLAAHPGTPQVKVAVTGHGVHAALIPPLTAELARHGMLASVYSSDFDSHVFDLANPDSALYEAEPDIVLFLLDPMMIFDKAPSPWQPADIEDLTRQNQALVERLISCFEATSRGTLVLNTMPLLQRFTSQLVAHTSRARLGTIWREANIALLRLGEAHPSVVTMDLDPLIAEGIAAEDARMSAYAKAHLPAGLLARYAREVGHLARHLNGQTKKVLALDMDGTLWGGVLAEDGPEGIEIGDTYRGAAFTAFQKVIKQLSSQGVLLTGTTKNDAEDVAKVLRGHHDMPLREGDFVRIAANWRPKSDNLTELASVLNLGVDSFAFVDDSSYECGLIRHALPGVAVVPVTSEPALHIGNLLRDGWFDTLQLTAEDRTRVEKYQEEMARQDFLDSFDSLDDYLRELDVKVTLDAAGERHVARVSQLTQRTNQFNLTTRRLQPAQVRELIADPAALTLAVRVSDRFGDHGLVGAIFAHRGDATLHIDNFVLSCRVFSRGIEQACLTALLEHARATGAGDVTGEYRPTAKNAKVRDFYPRNGFTTCASTPPVETFRHDLTEIAPPPAHVNLSTPLEGWAHEHNR